VKKAKEIFDAMRHPDHIGYTAMGSFSLTPRDTHIRFMLSS
jgi:hypothetical protein